jgi:hypothetical protein
MGNCALERLKVGLSKSETLWTVLSLCSSRSCLLCYLIVKALRRGTSGSVLESSEPQITSGKSFPFSEVSADPNFPHVRSIRTKIRGVTRSNPDGVNRQSIIRRWCRSGDALYLIREPKNPFDPNAIQVRRIIGCDPPQNYRLGEQLGYLSRELAEELAQLMDEQKVVLMAEILNVTGAQYGWSLGVNIQVEEYRRGSSLGRRVGRREQRA